VRGQPSTARTVVVLRVGVPSSVMNGVSDVDDGGSSLQDNVHVADWLLAADVVLLHKEQLSALLGDVVKAQADQDKPRTGTDQARGDDGFSIRQFEREFESLV